MSEKQKIPRKPVSQGGEDNVSTSQPEEPPPYSSGLNPLPAPSPGAPETFPGYGNIILSNYIPSNASLSDDQTTVTTYDPKLCSNSVALGMFLQEQAALPPKLLLRIKGTRSSNSSTTRRIDFDLTLNMTPLLITKNSSQSLNYIKLAGDKDDVHRGSNTKATRSSPSDPKTLNQWIHRFCTDNNQSKKFTLTRAVSNINTSYLEGQIRNLVASTAYRGHLIIEFPTTYAATIVSTANPSLFGISFAALLGGTHKYEVAQAVWPYADAPPGTDGRRCAVLSEEAWWGSWKESILSAVLVRRQGAVTVEDQVEVAMNPVKKGGKMKEWGVEE